MNQAQIRKKFRDSEQAADRPRTTSDELAAWIAGHSAHLEPTDLEFLISVGRTLYAAEAEKRWRDAW